MIKLVLGGMQPKDVAERFGVSTKAVQLRLRRYPEAVQEVMLTIDKVRYDKIVTALRDKKHPNKIAAAYNISALLVHCVKHALGDG